MADTVSTQLIQDGDRLAIMKFTNISDGTGEAAVLKVDVSTLANHTRTGRVCDRVHIERVFYDLSGMTVDILWDANVDLLAFSVSGSDWLDFRKVGPITNNGGAGVTGDIKFTTSGQSSSDRYSILLELSKHYEIPVLSC